MEFQESTKCPLLGRTGHKGGPEVTHTEGFHSTARRSGKMGCLLKQANAKHPIGWKGKNPSQEGFRKSPFNGRGNYLSTTIKLTFFTVH